jgi:hypothetical protein
VRAVLRLLNSGVDNALEIGLNHREIAATAGTCHGPSGSGGRLRPRLRADQPLTRVFITISALILFCQVLEFG